MKILFSNALIISILSVAVGVNGAPPPANAAATAKAETAAVAPITPHDGGATNPGRPAEHTLAVVGSTFSGVDFLGSRRDEPASGSERDGRQSGVSAAPPARSQLFAPPEYSWQNLPFKTEIPGHVTPSQTNSSPGELHRNVEEGYLARIQRLVRQGGLKPASQSDRLIDDKMSRVQDFQPYVTFSGDQINILNTFLK